MAVASPCLASVLLSVEDNTLELASGKSFRNAFGVALQPERDNWKFSQLTMVCAFLAYQAMYKHVHTEIPTAAIIPI